MYSLPQGAREALDALLEAQEDLTAPARALSLRYRQAQGRAGEGKDLLTGEFDVLAYASSRLPATFAAVSAALEQALPCLPQTPKSLLDVGAGPGTASLAALALWPELELCLVERDARMASLAGRLLSAEGKRPRLLLGDLRQTDCPACDLVVAAYSLLELAEEELVGTACRLYGLARQALLLVEPGTPAGHARLQRIRAALQTAGGHVAAPCPNRSDCPLREGDWCAFSQRLQRSAEHRRQKGGSLGYEDEKFSYLLVTKERPTPVRARVRRHPRLFKGYVELELCTAQGAELLRVAKSSPLYRQARQAKAGQSFLPD